MRTPQRESYLLFHGNWRLSLLKGEDRVRVVIGSRYVRDPSPQSSPLAGGERGINAPRRCTPSRGKFQGSAATDYVGALLMGLWILAVAVRLIWINQPYVDHWSWRQSDVAAIARNF